MLESGNIDSNKDIIFNNQDIDFGYQNDDGENIIMYICKNYIKLFTLHEYLDDPMILYIIEILLKRGVDVNLRNKNGESAIFYAVRDKRSTGDMIRLLIKYGAQVNIWNNSNETPFMIAILNDISKFSAKALFQYVNPNLQDNNGNTSLIYFCQKNTNFKDNLQLIKLLLKIPGIDLNIQNNEGKTALMYACEINQRTSHEQLNFSTGFTLAADLGILNSEYLLRTKDERENLVPLLGLIKSMVNDFGAKKDLVDIHGRKALDYSKKNESWGNDLITKFLNDSNS